MARIPLVQRVDYILDACRGKTVLHLGCSDWPYTKSRVTQGNLLHLALREVASELWGLDSDAEGLAHLEECGVKNLVRGNLERLEDAGIDRHFDVIVAGEVIEHLSNPGLFLQGARRLMRDDTTLLLTTVNAYCGLRMLTYALRGRGGTAEPVHPDHVAYYSYRTLTHLLERESFHVRKLVFYDVGREHRPFNRAYWNFANDLCVGLAHQLADGLIVECTR